jgi:hypothetical protein
VLSILAQDAVIVPVSATSTKPTFSLVGRIVLKIRAYITRGGRMHLFDVEVGVSPSISKKCITPDGKNTITVKDLELAKLDAQHTLLTHK